MGLGVKGLMGLLYFTERRFCAQMGARDGRPRWAGDGRCKIDCTICFGCCKIDAPLGNQRWAHLPSRKKKMGADGCWWAPFFFDKFFFL